MLGNAALIYPWTLLLDSEHPAQLSTAALLSHVKVHVIFSLREISKEKRN